MKPASPRIAKRRKICLLRARNRSWAVHRQTI